MTRLNVLMVGTGEYTTGYVHGSRSGSDKGAGVVALTLFDLRARGLIDHLHMAGTNGTKFPGIRRHLQRNIGELYAGLTLDFLSYPPDDVTHDVAAYQSALEQLDSGDIVIIFTPDDTHFEIAQAAIRKSCHVLIAKPLVKTIAEHRELVESANRCGSLVAMEVHKRWDPMYADARDRIRALGDFSFFSSYMSQPKSQLETFSSWAGKSSDISYYLNAHHVDFSLWAIGDRARPMRVRASAATGCASQQGIDTEDTISLMVDFQHQETPHRATAIYTASWIAPRSDVHSQQRFFYQSHGGEIQIDQAHRGYAVATDRDGLASVNPLFMKYTPDAQGRFAGQQGYGYRSIEAFVLAARHIKLGRATPADFQGQLATAAETLSVTAILEAGRLSLDQDGRTVSIVYDHAGALIGID